MAIDLMAHSDRPFSLAEFSDTFKARKFEVGDDSSLQEASSLLFNIYANRSFLAEVVRDRLREAVNSRLEIHATSQTLNIMNLGDGHYLRMVFWPSKNDDFVCKTNSSVFYYGVPHDHNFSFGTIGYSGPGYDSDFYEIENETTDWFPGREVLLKPTGRRRLAAGRGLFYRRHVDVHAQLPPQENSISINLMAPATPGPKGRQFVFDADCKKVNQIMQSRFNPIVFAMASLCEGDEIKDGLEETYTKSPDSYVRYYAFRTLCSTDNASDRDYWIRKGATGSDALVQGWAKARSDFLSQA